MRSRSLAGTALVTAVLLLANAGAAAVAAAPVAATGTSSDLGPTSATVAGTVNPSGVASTWWVEYGTSTSYGSKTSAKNAGSGTANVDVSATLSRLTQGTTYHYRIVATNSAGTSQGADATFVTPGAPAVVTGAATNVTASSATLNGTVNPNGRPTSWYFEYGTGTGYGSKTATLKAGSGTAATTAADGASNLKAGTLYHFRLVATSDAGTTRGSDQTFSTTGSTPTVATAPASSVTATAAKLNGGVNPNGQATTAYFEYGTSTSYGSKTPLRNVGSGTRSTDISASVSGLGTGTTYHYRIVATNGSGNASGNDQSFVTAGPPSVQTGPAQSVGTTGATLTGSVNPNGRSTSWYFEYGSTTGYGSKTATQGAGSGTGTRAASAAVSGLAAGSTYHYRLVASSGAGTNRGADAAFTTAGAVAVAVATSLRASALTVVYGGHVTLSGTVSSKRAGETVAVLAERFGRTAFTTLATLSTGSGGRWAYAAKPAIRTSYEASSGGRTSPAVSVGVRPAVSLRLLSNARFSTHIAAARSFAGKVVQLQRRTASGRWITITRTRLSRGSSAVFRPKLPHGTSRLRVAMSVNQAGAGYLAGFSRTVAYRRG